MRATASGFCALGIVTVVLAACGNGNGDGDGDAGGTPVLDAGVPAAVADAGAPDAGHEADSGPRDYGPLSYGTKLGVGEVDIVGVASDSSEVYFYDSTGALRAMSPATGLSKVLHDAARNVDARQPVLWMRADIDESTSSIHSYRTGATTTTEVVRGAAHRVLYVGPGGQRAIAADRYRTRGTQARLVAVSADGADVTVLTATVTLGRWNNDRQRFEGACAPVVAFTSSTSAAAVICASGATEPSLYTFDLVSGASVEVATTVQRKLSANPTERYFLFWDGDGKLHGADADGSNATALDSETPVSTVRLLDGRRFAYSTKFNALEVATWPDMTPTTLHLYAGARLRGTSPTGQHLLVSQSYRAPGDLNLIATFPESRHVPRILSERPAAYPGEDAFSADGRYALYYVDLDGDFIGDAVSLETTAGATPVRLAERAYVIRHAGDRAMVMFDARKVRSGNATIVVANLAVRSLDGGGPLHVLATGVHATDYALFPERDRIVYRVVQGASAGLWVRSMTP